MNAFERDAPEAARAAWLSELNKAIDEAQWLAWRIGVVEGRNAQALELYVQLEAIRTEVEAMWPRGISKRQLDTLRKLAAAGKRLKE